MKAAFPLILIASALLLSGASSASAASHNPRPNKHQESTNKETQTAKPLQPEPTVPLRNLDSSQAATLDALRALHAEQEARAEENRAHNEAFYANLISLGLLFVGVVYSCLAWKQWAAIKEQAKIANDALIENRKAADAAKRSADALALTERAFILFDDRPSPDPRDTDELVYRITNGGRTPAYVKKLTSCVRLSAAGADGIPASLYDPTVSYKTAPDIAVLGPEQTLGAVEFIGPADHIYPTVEQQIRNQQRALWFWGFVVYVDAFKQEHVSEWCRFWVPSPADGDQGVWRFVEEPGRNIAT